MGKKVYMIFLAAFFLLCMTGITFGQTNLALNRPVTVSSTEANLPGSNAVDGNTGTRWGSDFSDPQWIMIDLGSTVSISRVVLRWETAYGRSYQIQVSANGSSFTNIYSTTSGNGDVDDLSVSGSGRYIRMYGTARGTGWGYSLWEFEVYGGTPATNTPTNTPVPTPTVTLPTTASPTPITTIISANLALNRPATASSTENADFPAGNAVDGNTGTRWSSAFSDPQWIMVDLGSTMTISRIVLRWETACASAYQIQASNDGANFTTLYTASGNTGGVNDFNVSGSGRYVRMYGTSRATGWGYSLWEFEVFGPLISTSSPTPTRTPTSPPSTATRTATPTPSRTPTPTTPAVVSNLALNKTTTSSSNENATLSSASAVDGNTGTRWASAFSDPQWIMVDLGSTASISRIVLRWETAYGSAYQIQVSNDGNIFTNIYSTSSGNGDVDDLSVTGSGRYVRMYGTARGTAWGYSLWEFEVYGVYTGPTPTPATTTPVPTGTGLIMPEGFWGDVNSIPRPSNVLMVKFLNRTNGAWADSDIYWTYNDNGTPVRLSDRDTFDMPANSSGRMYVSIGSTDIYSPTTYHDFIEFTIGPNQFNGNMTRVDAWGIKMAMRLICTDGYDFEVGEDYETFM
ncbi:MAG: discoidin domain-containing protein, partial [Spirochaetales bacterium]|nr:discoidin domain-containing protein [Spirochaetales bacterium]